MLASFYDAEVILSLQCIAVIDALMLVFVISWLVVDWLVSTRRGYGIGERAGFCDDVCGFCDDVCAGCGQPVNCCTCPTGPIAPPETEDAERTER